MADQIIRIDFESAKLAHIEKGVVINVIMIDKTPRKFAGIDTDALPYLRKQHPDAEFVVIPEELHPQPGIGWAYDAVSASFVEPPRSERVYAGESSESFEGKAGEDGVAIYPEGADREAIREEIRRILAEERIADTAAKEE